MRRVDGGRPERSRLHSSQVDSTDAPVTAHGHAPTFGKRCVFGEGCEFPDGCKFTGGCWFDRGCWFGLRCTFEVGRTVGEDCRYWAEDDEDHAEDDSGDSIARWHVYVLAERHPANLACRRCRGIASDPAREG